MPKLELKLPDQISDAVATPVKNLTDKPTQSIGSGFADIFDLVFDKFGYLKEKQQIKYSIKLEQYKQKIQNKINNIPEEKLCEPDLRTVGTALENSKFCVDSDELTEMFANLIKSSIDIDTKDFVHPAFSEIIKQMTPLEARIISFLKKESQFPICEYQEIVDTVNTSYKTIMTNVLIYQDSENNINKNSYSLTNLERLGLVSISYMGCITDESVYEPYEDFKSNLVKDSLPKDKIKLKKGFVSITPLGRQFVNVCISD